MLFYQQWNGSKEYGVTFFVWYKITILFEFWIPEKFYDYTIPGDMWFKPNKQTKNNNQDKEL